MSTKPSDSQNPLLESERHAEPEPFDWDSLRSLYTGARVSSREPEQDVTTITRNDIGE